MKVLSNEDRAQIAIGLKHFCHICRNTPVINGKRGWTYYNEAVCDECSDKYRKGRSIEDIKYCNGV